MDIVSDRQSMHQRNIGVAGIVHCAERIGMSIACILAIQNVNLAIQQNAW